MIVTIAKKCYQGDYEDMYRLKEEGKVYSIQDVILKCIRRRIKKGSNRELYLR